VCLDRPSAAAWKLASPTATERTVDDQLHQRLPASHAIVHPSSVNTAPHNNDMTQTNNI